MHFRCKFKLICWQTGLFSFLPSLRNVRRLPKKWKIAACRLGRIMEKSSPSSERAGELRALEGTWAYWLSLRGTKIPVRAAGVVFCQRSLRRRPSAEGGAPKSADSLTTVLRSNPYCAYQVTDPTDTILLDIAKYRVGTAGTAPDTCRYVCPVLPSGPSSSFWDLFGDRQVTYPYVPNLMSR